MTMRTLICDCNKTMTLDHQALQQALGPEAGAGLEPVHTLLCRREAGSFQRAAKTGEDLLIACTQESQLFGQLNEQTEGALPLSERPIRFVNIRETAAWSAEARQRPAAVLPKIAALIAQAQLPEAAPVATVSYRSHGRLLIIGDATRATQAAQHLAGRLDISLFLTSAAGALPQQRDWPVYAGDLLSVQGWLGEFQLKWQTARPIDLDLCTRCNACISACPEGAIDFSYQIDLQACKSHRACVTACGAAGAIDFEREPLTGEASFDLLLDLRETPAFAQHQPPQGYFHVGTSEARLFDALSQLLELKGEFEKPKFFDYKPKLCAHTRNEKIGCRACIDVCSTRAIRSDATLKGKVGKAGVPAGIVVEAHLCVGCGACTTVCPSGALTYATPGPQHQGLAIRTLLSTYRRAGGRNPALLLHSQGAGARMLADLGRAAQATGCSGLSGQIQGLPARVLPLALWHSASVGLELWLSALAQGASQVLLLLTEEEAPEYREALAAQAEIANSLMAGLGFAGPHIVLLQARDARDLDALDSALRLPPAQTVASPAGFNPTAEKRATLELALEQLLQQAPLAATLPEQIDLPRGPAFSASPLGSISVDADRCSMCLSCVSACPAGALADNPDKLQLRFIEKNCVQCGLCASTCPEKAISLQPRLLLLDGGRARKQQRVLNEVEPFCCVRCAKPFASPKAIELMLAKLGAHPMFQGAARERLQMCGDCRVIDMHSNPNEVRIDQL